MGTTLDQKPHLLKRAYARTHKVGIGIVVLAVLLSWPFGVIILSKDRVQWVTLSNFGQAFGVLSAVALIGVAGSIFFQSRQERAQRIQMVRDYHLELRRIALDQPEVFMPCWRPIEAQDLDLNGRRQHLYLHLTVNYAWMSYSVGVMNDKILRDLCIGIFKGEAGRYYWQVERETWQLTAGGRQGRQFVDLIEKVYKAAKDSGDPEMGRTIDSNPNVRPSIFTRGVADAATGALAGLSAGVLLASVLRRSHRDRPER